MPRRREAALTQYADWKAPAEDQGVLVWPEPSRLIQDTHDNHHDLSSADDVLIQNMPLPQLRKLARQFIGHDDAKPLIANGHQTELYHAGVWAKNALMHAAAPKIGADALHLAVDTDAPKHLALRWPGASWPLTDDPHAAKAQWTDRVAPPTPAHLKLVTERLDEASAGWKFEPVAKQVLASLRRLSLESKPLANVLTNAIHELDWSLGLRHASMVASPLWASEAYLAFAHHLMARLDVFAKQYNAALSDYRRQTGTNNPMRPMPDLFVGDDAIEAPFWLDDFTTGQRTRPSVFKIDGMFAIQLIGGEEFIFDPNADAIDAARALSRFLTSANHRLAPRALTLTMFLRLLIADQFVHGIGGARYDQVTDRIILEHFGIAPPRFSVATATLFFPEAVDHPRVCLPCLRQEGHRLRNAALGERKRELVAQIEALPRRSSAREEIFSRMHDELDSAASESPKMQQWKRVFDEALVHEQQEQVLFDRELFYAIQSKDRLESLMARFADPFQ